MYELMVRFRVSSLPVNEALHVHASNASIQSLCVFAMAVRWRVARAVVYSRCSLEAVATADRWDTVQQ